MLLKQAQNQFNTNGSHTWNHHQLPAPPAAGNILVTNYTSWATPDTVGPFCPSLGYLSKFNSIKPWNIQLTPASRALHQTKPECNHKLTGQSAEVSFKELHCHPLAYHLHLSAILFLHVIFHGLFQIWNTLVLFIAIGAALNAQNSNHRALCVHSGNQDGLANFRFPEVEPASSALERINEIALLAKSLVQSRLLANGHYSVVVIFGAGGYNFDFIFLMSGSRTTDATTLKTKLTIVCSYAVSHHSLYVWCVTDMCVHEYVQHVWDIKSGPHPTCIHAYRYKVKKNGHQKPKPWPAASASPPGWDPLRRAVQSVLNRTITRLWPGLKTSYRPSLRRSSSCGAVCFSESKQLCCAYNFVPSKQFLCPSQ